MANWFSPYGGADWNIVDHQYNELFKLQVRLISQWFSLRRVNTGLYVHTGKAKRYVFKPHKCGWNHSAGSDDRPCSVLVREFKWAQVGQVNGRLSPIFRLELTIYDPNRQVLFQGPLVIEFNPDFPMKPPYFRVDQPRYTAYSAADGSHHLHARGIMCIMGGGYHGYSAANWDPRVDTVVTALNRALELIVWHVAKYGW